MLDLSSLEKALVSLRRAVERFQQMVHDEEIRDAVIQRFEYSYELCCKMLKRRLEQDAATRVEIDQLSFKELFREGAVRGYVARPEKWFDYRLQRNLTSHTYDHMKAQDVYKAAIDFLPDAEQLLLMLKKP